MQLWKRFFIFIAGLAAAFALSGCGGSSNSSSGSATLRFINAAKSSPMTVTINGAAQFTAVPASSVTTYATQSAGSYTLTIASSDGSLSSTTLTLSLASSQKYTLLAYSSGASIRAAIFTENLGTPLTGYASLNVANISIDSGGLDVYVVAPGTSSLTGLTPTFQYVTNTTSAATLVAGTYDVIATASGNRNDVRFTLPSMTLATTQIATLAFTNSVSGALVNGALVTQGGAVTFYPTSLARVRVVSALPAIPSSAVVATIGSAVLPAVYAPNPGAYALVAADSSTYSITVNGTAIASLPAASFAAGADSTILVYGTTAAPKVSIFADDNHMPISGQANVRLVNAAANVAGGLTLYDNGLAVANSIAYGSASSYVGVTSSSAAVLQLVQPGSAPVSTTATLQSGAVYTVFVVDSSLAPYIIKDR